MLIPFSFGLKSWFGRLPHSTRPHWRLRTWSLLIGWKAASPTGQPITWMVGGGFCTRLKGFRIAWSAGCRTQSSWIWGRKVEQLFNWSSQPPSHDELLNPIEADTAPNGVLQPGFFAISNMFTLQLRLCWLFNYVNFKMNIKQYWNSKMYESHK